MSLDGDHRATDNTRAGTVTLKEFLLDTINERHRQYEQRFTALISSVSQVDDSVRKALSTALDTTKEALQTATSNTEKALNTANANIQNALASIDKRFDAVNEFRAQLSDQQETFARKEELEQKLMSIEKAFIKSESQFEKRLESVNEAKAVLEAQQRTFIPRLETEVKFDSLEEQIKMLMRARDQEVGKGVGVHFGWAIVVAAVGMIGAIGSLFLKH